MAVQQYGSTAAWQYSRIEVRQYGSLIVWQFNSMAGQQYSSVAVQQYGSAASSMVVVVVVVLLFYVHGKHLRSCRNGPAVWQCSSTQQQQQQKTQMKYFILRTLKTFELSVSKYKCVD